MPSSHLSPDTDVNPDVSQLVRTCHPGKAGVTTSTRSDCLQTEAVLNHPTQPPAHLGHWYIFEMKYQLACLRSGLILGMDTIL